jgi:hypothetical protein
MISEISKLPNPIQIGLFFENTISACRDLLHPAFVADRVSVPASRRPRVVQSQCRAATRSVVVASDSCNHNHVTRGATTLCIKIGTPEHIKHQRSTLQRGSQCRQHPGSGCIASKSVYSCKTSPGRDSVTRVRSIPQPLRGAIHVSWRAIDDAYDRGIRHHRCAGSPAGRLVGLRDEGNAMQDRRIGFVPVKRIVGARTDIAIGGQPFSALKILNGPIRIATKFAVRNQTWAGAKGGIKRKLKISYERATRASFENLNHLYVPFSIIKLANFQSGRRGKSKLHNVLLHTRSRGFDQISLRNGGFCA